MIEGSTIDQDDVSWREYQLRKLLTVNMKMPLENGFPEPRLNSSRSLYQCFFVYVKYC